MEVVRYSYHHPFSGPFSCRSRIYIASPTVSWIAFEITSSAFGERYPDNSPNVIIFGNEGVIYGHKLLRRSIEKAKLSMP
jgi:hypothetical protein